jgi:thioredoxin-dependent peroxiredoxin
MPMLEEGTRAPDFTAVAHDGATVKLSDYAGRYLLLWFYPKADTPG